MKVFLEYFSREALKPWRMAYYVISPSTNMFGTYLGNK
jgi:hypothetical protein